MRRHYHWIAKQNTFNLSNRHCHWILSFYFIFFFCCQFCASFSNLDAQTTSAFVFFFVFAIWFAAHTICQSLEVNESEIKWIEFKCFEDSSSWRIRHYSLVTFRFDCSDSKSFRLKWISKTIGPCKVPFHAISLRHFNIRNHCFC